MKTQYKLAIAVLAGIGLGGTVVEGIHAQSKAKPMIYTVAEINVKNLEGYMKDYVPKATGLIEKSGGKVLAASNSPVSLEGSKAASRVAIQVWKDMDQLTAYRNSAEFKENRKIGEKYASFRTIAAEARQ